MGISSTGSERDRIPLNVCCASNPDLILWPFRIACPGCLAIVASVSEVNNVLRFRAGAVLVCGEGADSVPRAGGGRPQAPAMDRDPALPVRTRLRAAAVGTHGNISYLSSLCAGFPFILVRLCLAAPMRRRRAGRSRSVHSSDTSDVSMRVCSPARPSEAQTKVRRPQIPAHTLLRSDL